VKALRRVQVYSQVRTHSSFSSVGKNFSFVNRHSRREDTRRTVRNGASLRQSLTVICYN
jgi:hypothetical protein